MKKAIWIALGVLLASGLFFFLVYEDRTSEVGESYRVEVVERLARVEILGPAGKERPELIVLERRGDRWWVTRPGEGPMAPEAVREMMQAFGRDIVTDDLRIDAERADEHGFGVDELVQVSLFGVLDSSPARKFYVGNEFVVAQTGARRTLIMDEEKRAIYRAQGSFGEWARLPLSELRDKAIVSVGEEGIFGVSLRHIDGHHVELEKDREEWRHVEQALGLEVDQREAARLANRLGRLEAVGFFHGSVQEAGLDSPVVVVEVSTGRGDVKLEVGQGMQDESPRYYVRRSGGEEIFEISREDAEVLTWRTADLRDRAVFGVGSDALSEIQLAGAEGLHLLRGKEGWEVSGASDGGLNQERVESLAQFVAGLRAEAWVDDESDLRVDEVFGQVEEVIVGIDGHATTLRIGGLVEEGGGARYARYSEAPGVFILAESATRRLGGGIE